MKITYDGETDTLRIVLREVAVRESEEERSEIILDYAADGQLVALEVLDAATRIDGVDSVELKVKRSLAVSDAAE